MICKANRFSGSTRIENVFFKRKFIICFSGGNKVEIINMRVFAGKNIYSLRPVIKLDVDIGSLIEKPTKDIPGFNDMILKLFPGLAGHCCSLGYEGGFGVRLKEGTYIGHVTEHLILEMQSLLGYDVSFGKTRVYEEPSKYYIVYEYKNECCAVECGKAAIHIIKGIVENTISKAEVADMLENIQRMIVENEIGPSTKAIYEEAIRRGIPVKRIGNESLLQLGLGKNLRLIQASLTDMASCVNVDIVSNKCLTKKLLDEYKIPVPYGEVAYSLESALKIAREIGFPVVVKPLNGNQGKGVSINILDPEHVVSAYEEALKYSKAIIVEQYIKGKDYRILVLGNKVSAVSERKPPFVVGDGVSSVLQLVEKENSHPLRGDDHEKPLTRIPLDSTAKELLKRNGMSVDYIPSHGETVFLRSNSNLSTGGNARDCTDEIHPHNREIAIKAAKIMNIDIAGIDMTIEDISVPIDGRNGCIIEVNAAPGLRMHLYPSEGKIRNVAADILDMMYPEGSDHSIPVVSITGTNGKTTTTRLIRHALTLTGKKVGMTTTSGIFIGDECILKGDNTGPVSAGMVLKNKQTDIAVLETARGGIIRGGLGYDAADVAIVTNISDDHIGIDGINDIEDLALVKSLVVEAVKPHGFSVLNADDPMVEYFLKRAVGKVILFSKDKTNINIKRHAENGGTCIYLDEDSIFIYDRKEIKLIDIKNIPITYDGKVKCNVENSLAAICGLYALKIPCDIIEEGLRTFKADENLNPGRFNLFDMGDFKVLVDYGHNIAGYKCVMDYIKSNFCKRAVGVVGMPGDRMDQSIKEVAALCGSAFDKIYIKEDDELRGRLPGEVAEIFCDMLYKNGYNKKAVEVILNEEEAFETALKNAKKDDLVVVFYQSYEKIIDIIRNHKTLIKEEHIISNMLVATE